LSDEITPVDQTQMSTPPAHTGSALTRRDLVGRAGALAGLWALSTGGWLRLPVAAAEARADGLSQANLSTFVAAVEAVCSFDGVHPPPRTIAGRTQPSAEDAAGAFDAEYRAQLKGFRDTVDLVLTFTEQAPRTPPPLGAVTPKDLAAYGGHTFSELEIPLRLHLLRSWQADHNHAPLDPPLVAATGIPDFGTLHRAIAYGATQLCTLFYYFDQRTWRSVGWGGPWLGRDHEAEELPFSHHGGHSHEPYRVRFGGGVVA
jgi:hypothetical protein